MSYPFDFGTTFRARWGKVLFETELAVQLAVFFHESQILQRPSARGSGADEVGGAPDLSKSGYERPPRNRKCFRIRTISFAHSTILLRILLIVSLKACENI